MASTTRRRLLLGLGLGAAGLVAARHGLVRWWRRGDVLPLHEEAADFVRRCFDGIDRRARIDAHVHLVGRGTGGSGCRLGPELTSPWSPRGRLVRDLLMAAAGVDDAGRADQQYLERLLARHRAADPLGRLLLLAFDHVVDRDGRERPDLSALVTPDEAVLAVAASEPDVLAAVSVHPYRRDAIARLETAAAAGARSVKWLPPAQGIDPADALCDPFYRRLAALDLPLLTHAGRESTIAGAGRPSFAHPLRLRRALDHGVRVIVAHAGAGGRGPDLDAPADPDDDAPDMALFDAFLRLFDEPQWRGQLFADVSGLVFMDRMGRPLGTMLSATSWHDRLLDGSDYPVCALDPVISARRLCRAGYLEPEEAERCEQVSRANPLLGDFVTKRSVKVHDGLAVRRFAPSVFETARVLGG